MAQTRATASRGIVDRIKKDLEKQQERAVRVAEKVAKFEQLAQEGRDELKEMGISFARGNGAPPHAPSKRRPGRPAKSEGKRGPGRPAGKVGRPSGKRGRPAAERVPRPGRGGRKREGNRLEDYMVRVMSADDPMSAKEIEAAVKKAGYQTKASNLKVAVYVRLGKSEFFKKHSYGQHVLSAAGTRHLKRLDELADDSQVADPPKKKRGRPRKTDDDTQSGRPRKVDVAPPPDPDEEEENDEEEEDEEGDEEVVVAEDDDSEIDEDSEDSEEEENAGAARAAKQIASG